MVLRLCVLLGIAMLLTASAVAETVTVDPWIFEVRRPFRPGKAAWEFAGKPNPQSLENGLRLRAGKDANPTAWIKQSFEGYRIIRFRVRFLSRSPASSPRLHCYFSAEGVTSPVAAATAPKEGYELILQERRSAEPPSLSVELLKHSENREGGPRVAWFQAPLTKGKDYEVVISKVGATIAISVDGRPVILWYDYRLDRAKQGKGTRRVGFAATSRRAGKGVSVEDIIVDQYRRRSCRPLEKLKDMCLETNLKQARLVVGSNPLHRELAGQLAAALQPRLGRNLEIVADREIVKRLPGKEPLIVLGNLADNRVVRKLYLEWFCMVDRAFPGKDGYIIQTIHNPWGTGQNVVLLGAGDDAGLRGAVERFPALVPAGGRLGRVYEVRPAEAFVKLRDYDSKSEPYLTLPLAYPHHAYLCGPVHRNAMVYLVTGDDRWAERCREELLKHVEAGKIIRHLYVPSWMIVWDMIEEHPVFSDAERLEITRYFLHQLRSRECIGALHIMQMQNGMPHGNHGTRPGIGTFFLARYFRNQYKLPETIVYLNRLSQYFGMQAHWSKPYCDSSGHQWNATLVDKAIYAFGSGEMGFFETGAARRAAERALRTTNNVGLLGVIGDSRYGAGAQTLLAMAAFYYNDPRYLWPLKQRGDERGGSDELGRTFAVHDAPREPADIIGVSVIPHDKGYWEEWRTRPAPSERFRITPPNVPYERAFDKIALRTGIRPNDEFLLLDGVVNYAHDYDDANTIHEYSRNGRTYLATCDGIFAPTMPHHNGVNIVRDGISGPLPQCAERLHAAELKPVMVAQTRINDFAGADWTRSIVFLPKAYFVVLDRIKARQEGTFTLTGHWRMLGKPEFSGDTLTVRQWKKGVPFKDENRTFFHMQAPGRRVAHKTMPYKRSLSVRYYPYARPHVQVLAQSRVARLAMGKSSFLFALGHETGREAKPHYRAYEVAPGVVRVTDAKSAAYLGAAGRPVRIGVVEIDADLFYLTDAVLCVAGGRRAVVDGKVIVESARPVTRSVSFAASDALKKQLASSAHDIPAGAAGAEKAVPALKRLWQVKVGGEIRTLRTENLPAGLGIVAVPSRAGRSAGKVLFLDATGKVTKKMSFDAQVNDVAVDDLDGDGRPEFLIAREDCTLQCLDAAGKERFSFAPKRERIVNSTLWLGRNSMQRVWVADHGGGEQKTIVVSSGDQHFHGLSPDGKRKWVVWARAGIFTTFGMCDVDGDGVKEIVGGNGKISAYDYVWAVKAENKNRWCKRIRGDGWGATLCALEVGDLDGDDRNEIVTGSSRASLRVIDPRTAETVWKRHLGDGVEGVRILRAAGEKPLVVAGSLSGFVSAFNGAGKKQWATPVGAPVVFLALVESGKEQVVMAVCDDGRVVALSRNGKITHRLSLPAAPTAIAVPEGRKDILCVAAQDGTVTALVLPERHQ